MARDGNDEFLPFFASEFRELRRLGFLLTGDWGEAEELAQEAILRTFAVWEQVLDVLTQRLRGGPDQRCQLPIGCPTASGNGLLRLDGQPAVPVGRVLSGGSGRMAVFRRRTATVNSAYLPRQIC
jgi:hypothetical protein